jgi:alcohol dehydrogenase
MMKALVYHGLGKKAWEEHANPTVIDPTDAIVRVTKTTICGTDLHILKGDLASLVKMIEAVRRFGAAA